MKKPVLSGKDLDRAVAEKLGYIVSEYGVESLRAQDKTGGVRTHWKPTIYWNQAGPIIDQYGITIVRVDDDYGTDAQGFCNNVRVPVWGAAKGQHSLNEHYGPQGDNWGVVYSVDKDDVVCGSTPLIAAMRAFLEN